MGTFIATLLAKKAAGHIMGLLASKTAGSATVGTGAGIAALIGPALGGDNAAIGAIVVMILGWLGTLIGRLFAKPDPALKPVRSKK